jgi:preprotein translocase subunit SecG
MLRTILTILQVISGLLIVGLVLLQRGKGADAGAGFGAGASGTVFGARGATTGLSRMTAIFAAVFMLNSLFLTYLFRTPTNAASESLLDKVQTSTEVTAPAPAPQPVDPDAVPTAPPAPAAQPQVEQPQAEQVPEKP